MDDERRRIPVPIACTLEPGRLQDQVGEWRALLRRALGPAEATAEGARVRLPAEADVEAEAERLMEAESACCAFFSFSLERSEGELVLSVAAPEEGRALAEGLFGLPPSA